MVEREKFNQGNLHPDPSGLTACALSLLAGSGVAKSAIRHASTDGEPAVQAKKPAGTHIIKQVTTTNKHFLKLSLRKSLAANDK